MTNAERQKQIQRLRQKRVSRSIEARKIPSLEKKESGVIKLANPSIKNYKESYYSVFSTSKVTNSKVESKSGCGSCSRKAKRNDT